MSFRDKNEKYEGRNSCIHEIKNREEPEKREQKCLKDLELEGMELDKIISLTVSKF